MKPRAIGTSSGTPTSVRELGPSRRGCLCRSRGHLVLKNKGHSYSHFPLEKPLGSITDNSISLCVPVFPQVRLTFLLNPRFLIWTNSSILQMWTESIWCAKAFLGARVTEINLAHPCLQEVCSLGSGGRDRCTLRTRDQIYKSPWDCSNRFAMCYGNGMKDSLWASKFLWWNEGKRRRCLWWKEESVWECSLPRF